MPTTASYQQRRGQLHEYFDRTASETWARLTSDAPVSGIRATVREGRRQMRELLLAWLPEDMAGMRLLDAGCGTGALAAEAAARGADVVAIDLAGSLVDVARSRTDTSGLRGSLRFEVGDFADRRLGEFDYVVAMDSLIHYDAPDIVRVLSELAPRTHRGMCLTFAPSTLMLQAMWSVGKLFPRSDRSPAIVPVSETRLRRLVAEAPVMDAFVAARSQRIDRGFYISNALELRRP